MFCKKMSDFKSWGGQFNTLSPLSKSWGGHVPNVPPLVTPLRTAVSYIMVVLQLTAQFKQLYTLPSKKTTIK